MVCINSEAESLIGLRPPRQDPRYQDAQRFVEFCVISGLEFKKNFHAKLN